MNDEISRTLDRLDRGDQEALLLLLSVRLIGPEPLTRLAQDILDVTITYFADVSGYLWFRRLAGDHSIIPEAGV